MARSRNAHRALRTASRHLHSDVAPSPGRRIAARRPRRSGRDAKRRDLHGLSLRPTAAQSRPLHARSGDGDSEDDLADGRLAAHAGRQGIPTLETPAPALPAHPFPRAAGFAKTSTLHRLPLDFQWLRTPWPEEIFSLTARPGFLRLYGRETIGSLFRQSLVARRQQSHCFSAATGRRVRAGTFSADGRPRLLLQQREVPLPLHLARRNARQTPARDVLPARLAQTDAFTPPIAIPAGRPVHLRVEVDYERLHFALSRRRRTRTGTGCRSSSTRAFSPTKPPRPACRISPARSSAWPVRTWPGRPMPADFDYFEYRERGYRACIERPTT